MGERKEKKTVALMVATKVVQLEAMMADQRDGNSVGKKDQRRVVKMV
jgi:hypothetical protein